MIFGYEVVQQQLDVWDWESECVQVRFTDGVALGSILTLHCSSCGRGGDSPALCGLPAVLPDSSGINWSEIEWHLADRGGRARGEFDRCHVTNKSDYSFVLPVVLLWESIKCVSWLPDVISTMKVISLSGMPQWQRAWFKLKRYMWYFFRYQPDIPT